MGNREGGEGNSGAHYQAGCLWTIRGQFSVSELKIQGNEDANIHLPISSVRMAERTPPCMPPGGSKNNHQVQKQSGATEVTAGCLSNGWRKKG